MHRPFKRRHAAPRRLLETLQAAYPDAASELIFKGPYQLVVSVVLSAQCTDRKVNEVTPAFFTRFPSFQALSQASLKAVEELIRPVNYYKTKARHLLALAKRVLEDFGGRLPGSLEELITLPGVGRKTANVVLCEQGAVPSLPVDTHVRRVSNRLALSFASKPEKVEEDLKQLFPPESWRHLHHALILHGRRVCKAIGPLCRECPLGTLCPSYGLFTKRRPATAGRK